jgi:hypothetical protein
MQSWPAVVVHGFDQACAALAVAGAVARGVTLLSGVGAGLYGGVGWWCGLISAASQCHPAARAQDVLDCADAPGAAMAALRRGQRLLVLDPACPAFPAVASAARGIGASVLAIRPRALELDRPGAARALAGWLAAGDSACGVG